MTPLYRIEQNAARDGVPLTRAMLGERIGRIGVALQPLDEHCARRYGKVVGLVAYDGLRRLRKAQANAGKAEERKRKPLTSSDRSEHHGNKQDRLRAKF